MRDGPWPNHEIRLYVDAALGDRSRRLEFIAPDRAGRVRAIARGAGVEPSRDRSAAGG